MKTAKNITLKIVLLLCLLIGMNVIYRLFFYEDDIQKHSDIIYLVNDIVENESEVIYVGESSNITMRGDDVDKRAISSFIADYFPDLKVGNITKEASHAGIYYALLNSIPADAKVKTVIITLNLRSFNAEWIYSKLETPLQKSIVLIKDYPPLWNRFLLSFKGYDIKTDFERSAQIHYEWQFTALKFPYPVPYSTVKEWDRAMAVEGIKKEDGTSDEPLTQLACHFIKTYAFQIDTLKNPRIKDFDRIVALAKKRNWNLIFNLMAENVEMADSLVGKDLIFLMKQNRDLLIERYQRMGVVVVDNFSSVKDEEFIDRDWTTEHYAEQGRKTVARNVAQALKAFYPNDYHEVVYPTEKQTTFFNNCDTTFLWTQHHTITKENAFSGKKSSKTGNGELYSLTFEYGIKNLPDSLQSVSIEMQIFQEDSVHQAAILLAVSGENTNYTLSYPLSESMKSVKQWQKINCKFDLGEDFYKGEIVKVFLYNQSNSVIFCDDIKITFQRVNGIPNQVTL